MDLASTLIEKRIKFEYLQEMHNNQGNNRRQGKLFSFDYSLRLCQCIRILSRDEELCSRMTSRDMGIDALVFKFNQLAKICINGEIDEEDDQNGEGPNGSGPI